MKKKTNMMMVMMMMMMMMLFQAHPDEARLARREDDKGKGKGATYVECWRTWTMKATTGAAATSCQRLGVLFPAPTCGSSTCSRTVAGVRIASMALAGVSPMASVRWHLSYGIGSRASHLWHQFPCISAMALAHLHLIYGIGSLASHLWHWFACVSSWRWVTSRLWHGFALGFALALVISHLRRDWRTIVAVLMAVAAAVAAGAVGIAAMGSCSCSCSCLWLCRCSRHMVPETIQLSSMLLR